MMEWIDGEVVRIRINEWIKRKKESQRSKDAIAEENETVSRGAASGDGNEELVDLLGRVGTAVGKLHAVGVVHGDLTTSNLMLRPWPSDVTSEDNASSLESVDQKSKSSLDGEVILIDFGLASQSSADEDRAVDLYVLERAFGSTHPSAEGLFGEVLKTYGKTYKGAAVVLKKLEDVRMRGRKRSMIG